MSKAHAVTHVMLVLFSDVGPSVNYESPTESDQPTNQLANSGPTNQPIRDALGFSKPG